MIDSPSNPRLGAGANPRLFEKSFSSGVLGMNSFYGNRVSSNLASRRREPYNKRPLLIATNTAHDMSVHTATASALPVMDGESARPAAMFSLARAPRPVGQPVMRRAHSVCDQPESSEGPSKCDIDEASRGTSGATGRVVSHIETGTSGLQAIHHLGGRITPDNFGSSGDANAGKIPFAQAGLLGFGANEIEGKVLPCHSVKEDGLVRVTRETVHNQFLEECS
jgi:M-phase inducer tyrosine phosphatase